MKDKKRKGDKEQAQQTAATKRYLDKNAIAKVRADRSRLKSSCLRFINDFATLEELKEIEKVLKNKKMEILKMEGFEKLGTGWFPLKDNGTDVYLIALKKDVNIEANTIHGYYIAYLKENANCLTEKELKQFFLDKTGKEYTTEELRKSSTYKKFLDELVIMNFAYVNNEFIKTTSKILENF